MKVPQKLLAGIAIVLIIAALTSYFFFFHSNAGLYQRCPSIVGLEEMSLRSQQNIINYIIITNNEIRYVMGYLRPGKTTLENFTFSYNPISQVFQSQGRPLERLNKKSNVDVTYTKDDPELEKFVDSFKTMLEAEYTNPTLSTSEVKKLKRVVRCIQ